MNATGQVSTRRQFLINVLSNGGIFALGGVVSAWYTPYLIRNLGIAAYGLVPLAMSLIAYFTIITLALNGACGRFLAIDLETGDVASANRTFNTALVANALLVAILLPVGIGMAMLAPRIFHVPSGQEGAAQLVFACTVVAFLLATLESSFSVSSWAKNRFDLRNGVAFGTLLVRVALVAVLFSCLKPALWQVAAGIVGAALFSLAGNVVVWHRLTPHLRIAFQFFDRSRIRQLFNMGGWLMVDQIGALFFQNTDLIIVNALIGAEMGGKYGSLLLWSSMLRAMASAVTNALVPIVVAKYARQDRQSMSKMARESVRIVGLAMALPIGLICGLSRPFLAIWLGPSFADLAPILVILVLPLCVNLAVLPLFGYQVALNKVRTPAIATLVLGAANMALSVVAATRIGAPGIAIAGAVVFTLRNTLFSSIYGARIQHLPWWTFLWNLAPGVAGALGITLLASALASAFSISSWLMLIGAGLIISCGYVLIVYGVGLEAEEKTLLRSFLPVRAGASR